ncbi:hypothetical protein HN873_008242, partial [Arachis hypogaea]
MNYRYSLLLPLLAALAIIIVTVIVQQLRLMLQIYRRYLAVILVTDIMPSSKSMAKGGHVKDELETKKPTPPQQQNHVVVATSAAVPPSLASFATKKEGSTKKNKKEGFKSISITERFNCMRY